MKVIDLLQKQFVTFCLAQGQAQKPSLMSTGERNMAKSHKTVNPSVYGIPNKTVDPVLVSYPDPSRGTHCKAELVKARPVSWEIRSMKKRRPDF